MKKNIFITLLLSSIISFSAVAENKTDNTVNRNYIENMIIHHRDAINMSVSEIENGNNQQMKEIAKTIIKSQSLEIEKLQNSAKLIVNSQLKSETPTGIDYSLPNLYLQAMNSNNYC